jgi:CBS-domain-containing membrane protein
MQTTVRTVPSNAPVSDVVVSLADARVSGLPVVDTRGKMVGVISSTDLIAAQAEARTPTSATSWNRLPCRIL